MGQAAGLGGQVLCWAGCPSLGLPGVVPPRVPSFLVVPQPLAANSRSTDQLGILQVTHLGPELVSQTAVRDDACAGRDSDLFAVLLWPIYTEGKGLRMNLFRCMCRLDFAVLGQLVCTAPVWLSRCSPLLKKHVRCLTIFVI